MPTANLPCGVMYYAQTHIDASPYPALVLIHGAGVSHLDWPPQLRRLPGVRVIALDLPGHGKSTGSSRTEISAYADDVCTFLNALRIERAIIAGHSMGGGIALQMGITQLDRVAGLILLGTGSKLPVEPTLIRRIIEEPDAAVDWLVDWAWGKTARAELKHQGRLRLIETPREVLHDDYIACQTFDVRPHLEQITAPTLVIAAREDRMMQLKFSETLAERIPQAKLAIIENAGHMFPLEKGQEVANIIQKWLSEQI